MERASKSTQEIGQESQIALDNYIQALRAEGKGLPARNGKVSASAVAMAAGVDRQTLYKNPGCRALIEKAAQELGLQGIEVRESEPLKDGWKDQRIQTLEAQVVSLTAEVQGLRRRLAQFHHIEQHMVETGRRVIP